MNFDHKIFFPRGYLNVTVNTVQFLEYLNACQIHTLINQLEKIFTRAVLHFSFPPKSCTDCKYIDTVANFFFFLIGEIKHFCKFYLKQ